MPVPPPDRSRRSADRTPAPADPPGAIAADHDHAVLGRGGPEVDAGDERDEPDEPDEPDERGVAHLRALVGSRDGWLDRVDGLGRFDALGRLDGARVRAVLDRMGIRRVAAVLAAAGVLGAVAFLVLGPGRGPAIDPVQVLPRVAPAAAGSGAAPIDPAPAAPTSAPSSPSATSADGAGDPSRPAGTVAPRIQVHAAGAVARPGVHDLGPDARVGDLIAAAGGLAPDADLDRVNLAAPLHDGERVYVPRVGEAEVPPVVAGGSDPSAGGGPAPGGGRPGGAGPPSSAGPAARVDLNTADAAALDALPGVGPATAAAIIRHREENGRFRSVDDLQDVPGIGPAKLAALRDLVSVG